MVEAKLYIEGGGSKSKALGISFRQGWRRFFEAAEVHNIKIVHGGGREQTFRKFKRATEELSYGIVPMLLVDSESAVDEGTSAWEHLKKMTPGIVPNTRRVIKPSLWFNAWKPGFSPIRTHCSLFSVHNLTEMLSSNGHI